MTVLNMLLDFEEERALMRRRRRRPKLRAARALAARLPRSGQREGADGDEIHRGIVGVAAGTALILAVKISMLWTALRIL